MESISFLNPNPSYRSTKSSLVQSSRFDSLLRPRTRTYSYNYNYKLSLLPKPISVSSNGVSSRFLSRNPPRRFIVASSASHEDSVKPICFYIYFFWSVFLFVLFKFLFGYRKYVNFSSVLFFAFDFGVGFWIGWLNSSFVIRFMLKFFVLFIEIKSGCLLLNMAKLEFFFFVLFVLLLRWKYLVGVLILWLCYGNYVWLRLDVPVVSYVEAVFYSV